MAAKAAEKKFSISIEKRLKWLEEIVIAGLGVYHDQVGNERRENLAAARGAIQTLNEMLGTGEDDHTGQPIAIQFSVSPAVGKVKVTNAKAE